MKFFICAILLTLSTINLHAEVPSDIKRACDALSKKIDKPSLPTQRIVIGSIVNPIIPPEVKSQCLGTYDTGVPDPSTCRLQDGGSNRVCSQIPYCDFRGCGTQEECVDIPNAPRTVCSNIIACNTYKTEKRFNVCEVAFTLKMPKFIAAPISKYVDKTYNTITTFQNEVKNALPLECASETVRNSTTPNYGQSLADAVTNEIKQRLQEELKREGEEWLARTGIETVLASIPTGGVGGAAALGTSVADFIYTAKNIADDYIELKEIQTFAEDLDFSVSCHPGEWSLL
jgi:hypothetical protein